jgi:hypothetical protein
MPWPGDVLEAVELVKQGDLLEDLAFFYFGDVRQPLLVGPHESRESEDGSDIADEAAGSSTRDFDVLEVPWPVPTYGIITSQTCDLAEEGEPQQPWFQASPAYRLGDEFKDKTLPAYLAPLEPPDLSPGPWVADLRLESAFEKSVLVGRRVIPAYPDEAGYLDFASRLGRRRDRAALATELIESVAGLLRRKLSNNKRFGEAVKNEIVSVRLNIPRGTRLRPLEAAVHVISRGPIADQTRERFEKWWTEAHQRASEAGIQLLPNAYHDGTAMNVEEYERLTDLGIV